MTDSNLTALEHQVGTLMIECLHLDDLTPSDIDPDAPLFREGLGLDSIDALEIALAISRQYGFQLQSDDQNNVQIFRSLRTLTQHIATHRL